MLPDYVHDGLGQLSVSEVHEDVVLNEVGVLAKVREVEEIRRGNEPFAHHLLKFKGILQTFIGRLTKQKRTIIVELKCKQSESSGRRCTN